MKALFANTAVLFLFLSWIMWPISAQGEGKRLGVLKFEEQGGRKHPVYSEIIADVVQNQIIKNSSYTVIERIEFEKILDEQRLQLKDIFDAENRVRLGLIKGVEYLLIGRYHIGREKLRLSARIVDIETGVNITSRNLSKVITRGSSLEDLVFSSSRELAQSLCAPQYRASSEYHPDKYKVQNAFDNDYSTFWWAAPGTWQGWIEVIFAEERTFSKAKFISNGSGMGKGVPKSFLIEYFVNGKWETAKKVRGNSMPHWSDHFDPSTSCRWRINIDSLIAPGEPIQISELMFE